MVFSESLCGKYVEVHREKEGGTWGIVEGFDWYKEIENRLVEKCWASGGWGQMHYFITFKEETSCEPGSGWKDEAEALKAKLISYGQTAFFRGTWFDGYADGYPVYEEWECSNCHSEFTNEGDPPDYTFCPYCGKLMVDPPMENEMDEGD